eukprot:gene5670-7693_t
MPKTTISKIAMLIAAVFIFGCNNAEKPVTKDESVKPTFDLANAKKEIEDINRTFMEFIVKGDSVGLANLYTADAKLMFAGAPADVGRANIQTAFSHVLSSGVTKADIKTIDVFGTEELLAEEGEVTIY